MSWRVRIGRGAHACCAGPVMELSTELPPLRGDDPELLGGRNHRSYGSVPTMPVEANRAATANMAQISSSKNSVSIDPMVNAEQDGRFHGYLACRKLVPTIHEQVVER